MIGIYIMMGGMALFAGIITAMDLLARRQRQKTDNDSLPH